MLLKTDIDLKLTLIDSAQCFHWVCRDGLFLGTAGGRPAVLGQEDGGVRIYAGDGDTLARYLDTERDYDSLPREYTDVPGFGAAYRAYRGLKVLRQEPWDALVQFIVSANNNVKRIRGTVLGLCERYGEAFDTDRGTVRALPAPERLAACREDELKELGAGYRAPYLIRTARIVCDGFPLRTLADMDYDSAREALLRLPGVGDKVANCVLLFGLGHTDAFPVDTWMEKLLRDRYGYEARSRELLAREARARLGRDAGLLQQYMFHAMRSGIVKDGEE